MDRVEAAAEQAGLRAVAVERDAEREHLAGLDEFRRMGDVLGRHEVEGADLVVLAPASPVRELLGRLLDCSSPDLDIHRTISSMRTRAAAKFGAGYWPAAARASTAVSSRAECAGGAGCARLRPCRVRAAPGPGGAGYPCGWRRRGAAGRR